jgi:prepilin-type N-terminal cleavage/methylation domain-containing protein
VTRESGFTLPELVVTMAIAVTVLAICIAWVPPMTEVMQADSDLQLLKGQISLARESATNQRRSVELQFLTPNVVQIVRQNLPSGTTADPRAQRQMTIFIGQPTRPLTARALTIFGPTARLRGYRWNGATWRQ